MQVAPGPDGTTDWWARIPAGRSAAAWAAVRDLGEEYAGKDPALTVDQARADAFIDLLLTNVTVTTKVTLGIPVITGPDGDTARAAAMTDQPSEGPTGEGELPTGSASTADAGGTETTRTAGSGETGPESEADWARPAVATGGCGLGGRFSLSAALISGCEIPGIGFIDADTVEALLTVVPTDIGRALLDARTGTLIGVRQPPPTGHPRRSPTSSPPATAPAGCGAATAPPPAATSTTPDPGRSDPPPPPTSAGSAAGTTASSNADAGPTTSPPTAPPPGPPHQAPSAPPCPTTPCSHHRRRNPPQRPSESWRR